MDNIRFVLIVAFAMIVLLLWQAWQVDYGPKPALAQIENPETNVKEDLPTNIKTPEQATTSGQPKDASSSNELASTPVVTVKTDVLALEIDMRGGTVQNLDLLDYPVEKDNTIVNALRKIVGLAPAEKNHKPVRLFDSK